MLGQDNKLGRVFISVLIMDANFDYFVREKCNQ